MNNIQYPVNDAHSFSTEEICKQLNANIDKGLSADEVKGRQESFGRNVIEQKKKKNPFLIFLAQFTSPMVYMLIVAAGLSFFFKEWLDGIAILAVILINAIIGFLMEYQAERSMEALKRMTQVNAKVIRDSSLIEIPSMEIVPGDILFLEAGDTASPARRGSLRFTAGPPPPGRLCLSARCAATLCCARHFGA